MICTLVLSLLCLCVPSTHLIAERIVVDTITRTVHGSASTELITLSQEGRVGLEGVPKTCDMLVDEALLYHLAEVYNLVPSAEEVEEALTNLLRERNLTLADFKGICENGGMTSAEGREEFRKMLARRRVVEFFVTSKLQPSNKAIRDYFEKNPQVELAMYHLQHVVVTYPRALSEAATEEFEKNAVRLITLGQEKDLGVKWSNVYEVTADKVADDKPFLHILQTGSISEPHKGPGHFILFKMVKREEEQVIPLEKRYNEIAQVLNESKFQELMEQLHEKAKQKVSVVCFS